MNTSLRIISNPDGADVLSYDPAFAEQATQLLENVSGNLERLGLRPWQVLAAISKGRKDTFDTFGVFCGVYSLLMRVLGSPVTLILSLVGILVLVRALAEKAIDFAEWAQSVFGRWLPLIVGLAGAGALGAAAIWRDEEDKATQSAQKLTSAALNGVLATALPMWLLSPLNFIVAELFGDTPPPGTGSVAPATAALQRVGEAVTSVLPAPVRMTMQHVVQPAVNAGVSAAGSIIDHVMPLLGKIGSLIFGDADSVYDRNYSAAELQTLANITGKPVSHIQRVLFGA